MKTAMILTVGLALAWTAAAQQDAAPKAPQSKIVAADTNKDGKVSFEEISVARPGITEERFKRMDRNSDGFLSPADRTSGAKPQPKETAAKGDKQDFAARVKACDKDGDGRVTQEEFKAGFPKATPERFAQLDRDKDGALTTADAPKKETPERAGDARHAMVAGLLKADADADGKVTFEEASTAKPGLVRADFNRFDTNKDGVLTKSDAKAGKPGQGKQDVVREKLRGADTDKDARVSWEEAQAAVPTITRERFDQADRNKDGFIAKDDRVKQP